MIPYKDNKKELKTPATNIVLTAYQQLSPEEKRFVKERLQLVKLKEENKNENTPDLLIDEEAAFNDLLENAIYREP